LGLIRGGRWHGKSTQLDGGLSPLFAEEYLSEDPTTCYDGGKRRNVVQQSKRIIDDQQPTTNNQQLRK